MEMYGRDRMIAHVAEDGRVHGLEEHLRETARRAGEFASEFGCREWGELTGLWHDLGKYSGEFQAYIRAVNNSDAHVNQKGGDGGRGIVDKRHAATAGE